MDELLEAPVTFVLLLLTVGITFYTFRNRSLWAAMALQPYAMKYRRQYHQLFTSGLIHADPFHLLLNMMTLFFFGPVLELTVGAWQFLVIYIVSLIIGSLYPYYKYRNNPEYVAIGASGAISGVVFSFCLFYPDAKIFAFMAIPMPAILYAVLYTAYSIYGAKHRLGNIGHEAHLAGAVGGIIGTLIVAPQVIDMIIAKLS